MLFWHETTSFNCVEHFNVYSGECFDILMMIFINVFLLWFFHSKLDKFSSQNNENFTENLSNLLWKNLNKKTLIIGCEMIATNILSFIFVDFIVAIKSHYFDYIEQLSSCTSHKSITLYWKKIELTSWWSKKSTVIPKPFATSLRSIKIKSKYYDWQRLQYQSEACVQ